MMPLGGRLCLSLAAVALVLLLFGASSVSAAPADLDPSFGGIEGISATPNLGGSLPFQQAEDLAVAPGGATFLISSGAAAPLSETWEPFLSRIRANGRRDRSFGSRNGYAAIPLAGKAGSEAASLTVDSSGRALVATASDQGLTLSRFTAKGNLDPRFGSAGKSTLSSWPQGSRPQLALDGGGRIVVVTVPSETACCPTIRRLVAARFLPAGIPDPHFGEAGIVEAVIPQSIDFPGPIALGGGGTLFAAGWSDADGGSVARLSADGGFDSLSLAPAFSSLGPRARPSSVTGLVPRPGGRLDVFGATQPAFPAPTEGLEARGFVVRLLRSGSPDMKFGRGGAKLLPWAVAHVTSLGGGMVFGVGGQVGGRFESQYAFRLRADDSIDRTFGGGAVPMTFMESPLGIAADQSGRPLLLESTALGFACGKYSEACSSERAPARLYRFEGEISKVRCLGHRATIVGTSEGERLVGTPHRDVIAALGGNDTVFGRGGNDLICAGTGRDKIFAGSGRDKVQQ